MGRTYIDGFSQILETDVLHEMILDPQQCNTCYFMSVLGFWLIGLYRIQYDDGSFYRAKIESGCSHPQGYRCRTIVRCTDTYPKRFSSCISTAAKEAPNALVFKMLTVSIQKELLENLIALFFLYLMGDDDQYINYGIRHLLICHCFHSQPSG